MKFASRKFAAACRLLLVSMVLFSCSVQKQIRKQARQNIFSKPEFSPANVGIAIYDPADDKYLYTHNADKLFVPASNTKLFSCYAGMKYLGDSLLSAYYTVDDDELLVQAAGDPTFLHPDFKRQPLFELMNQPRFKSVGLYTSFQSNPLGRGWAWDDFMDDYMAERDPFPIYGNLATFTFDGNTLTTVPPRLAVAGKPNAGQAWDVDRNLGGHFYTILNNKGTTAAVKVTTLPMESGAFAPTLLADTLHKNVGRLDSALNVATAQKLYSQPTDSLLSIMMHRSDNFFAEQTLLMVSNKLLGEMNDRSIIDTLLKTDYFGLPQAPKWVDGSGLSRYNLFSPQDFTWLLNKMKNDFGFERVQAILPTGNTGTLKGLYTNYNGRIFAKTGTLSNVVALSGYLVTRHNKTLIFSVLVNNHVSAAGAIRKDIEAFLSGLMERY